MKCKSQTQLFVECFSRETEFLLLCCIRREGEKYPVGLHVTSSQTYVRPIIDDE